MQFRHALDHQRTAGSKADGGRVGVCAFADELRNQAHRDRKPGGLHINQNQEAGLHCPTLGTWTPGVKDDLPMAQKSSKTITDKRVAKASKRKVGKPMRKQIAKQARPKPGQVEVEEQNLPRDSECDGGAMERVRIVFAENCYPCPHCGEPFCLECREHYAECKCVGPSNAEDLGYELREIDGTLYGFRPLPSRQS
jgi:hypothetical protein